MTLRAITVYRVHCNTCRCPLTHDGNADLRSKEDVANVLEGYRWLTLEDGKKHHCQSCRQAIEAAMESLGRGLSAALAASAKRKGRS